MAGKSECACREKTIRHASQMGYQLPLLKQMMRDEYVSRTQTNANPAATTVMQEK